MAKALQGFLDQLGQPNLKSNSPERYEESLPLQQAQRALLAELKKRAEEGAAPPEQLVLALDPLRLQSRLRELKVLPLEA